MALNHVVVNLPTVHPPVPGANPVPPRSEAKPADRMLIKSNGRVFYLNLDDITYVESEGNYVMVHTLTHHHLMRETMQTMEARLAAGDFLRVHRKKIIHLRFLKEVQTRKHLGCYVILQDNTRLPLGPTYRRMVVEKLRARG